MYLLRIETGNGRRYYSCFDGDSARPALSSKARAARMDAALCRRVLRQLDHLGFGGFEPVDEADCETPIQP